MSHIHRTYMATMWQVHFNFQMEFWRWDCPLLKLAHAIQLTSPMPTLWLLVSTTVLSCHSPDTPHACTPWLSIQTWITPDSLSTEIPNYTHKVYLILIKLLVAITMGKFHLYHTQGEEHKSWNIPLCGVLPY